MVIVRASKLNLPNPSLSPHISSLLFEPSSLSLALRYSDSSISLYPSLSLPRPSLPASHTLIPAPCSSSAFLLLQSRNPNSSPPDRVDDPSRRVLFVVAGPHAGGSAVLLRFYALRGDNKGFVAARVVCNQKGIDVAQKSGVLLNLSHGVSVKLTGSINYFALQSVSSSRISVFAVKLMDDGDHAGGDDGVVVVKLMRCAVIECSRRVWSTSILSGFLILGEESGVRVLNFRELVKGKKAGKAKNYKGSSNARSQAKKSRLPNGMVRNNGASDVRMRSDTGSCDCVDSKKESRSVPVKQKERIYRQESGEAGACFVVFEKRDAGDLNSKLRPFMSIKAISIQALSPKKYLILDSAGDLHLLLVSNHIVGSTISCRSRLLPQFAKVQRIVVLPEISPRTPNVWISDGDYTVHKVSFSDQDEDAADEKSKDESGEKPMSIAVAQTIFAAERVQDLVPLPDSGIMILGLGTAVSVLFGR